jgi:hypothetical protein
MTFPRPVRRTLGLAQRAVRFGDKRVTAALIRDHWARRAERAYGAVGEHLGRRALDQATERRIRSYAREVLGSASYAPWIRVFARYQERFAEGWIPEDFFARRVLPGLAGKRRSIGRRRTTMRRFLDTDRIPDLAYRINGRWFDTAYRMLGEDQLEELVFADQAEVYVKQEGLWQGLSVWRAGPEDFSTTIATLTRDAVVQRPVVQHPFFDAIYPGAVATLRIATILLDSDGPSYRGCRLRVAGSGDRWVRSQNQIAVPVGTAEGHLTAEGHDKEWRPFTHHPETGFRFDGATIPHFRDAVQSCLDLHARLPHEHVIGWDVAITPSGDSEIMEVNAGHIGINHFEATVGPIFLGCGFERFAPHR